MARDIFQMTVSQPDASGVLHAFAGIRISVFNRGTTNLVTIYQRSTGASEGPAPETGSPDHTNPFTTGASGSVEFWADGPKEYDIKIEDTQAPSRVATRTLGWNAFAAAPGSVPSSMLAADAGLALGVLSASVLRQVTQIGQVIDWWRPNDTVPLPPGFDICDGHQVPAGSHDFPVGGAINVPDLRNRMILGAVPATTGEAGAGGVFKPYAQGADQADTAAAAPGIGGTGGSNAARDYSHGHAVAGVDHTHLTPDHLHGVGGLYTGEHYHTGGSLYVTGHSRVFNPQGGSAEVAAFANSVSGIGGGTTDWAGNIGIGGSTGAADRSLRTGGADRSLATATNSTTWTADPGTDVRPRFYGLLKLMKVRRA
jgi:hypothetical protein